MLHGLNDKRKEIIRLKFFRSSLVMVIGLNGVQFGLYCNHTSDNKIGRPCNGSPICLSRVWLQTELDDTNSYYQLIIKITISEKRKIAKLCDKEKFYL